MKRHPLPPHTVAVVTRPTPYGAAELKQAMGPNMLRGLAAATVLLTLGLGTFAAVRNALAAETPSNDRVIEIIHGFDPPPPLEKPCPETEAAAPPKAATDAPKVGEIEPVPDAEADTTARVADNARLNDGPPSPDGIEGGQGRAVGGAVGPVEPPPVVPEPGPEPRPVPEPEPTPAPERVPDPTEFIVLEVQPTIKTQTDPVYPDILRRAGIEGRLIVRVLVGKDGRAEDVQIVRSDNEGFNQATLDAVRRWTFTPAIQAGQPVRVWMTIPVRFRQR